MGGSVSRILLVVGFAVEMDSVGRCGRIGRVGEGKVGEVVPSEGVRESTKDTHSSEEEGRESCRRRRIE